MAEGRDQKVDLRGASLDVVIAAMLAVCDYACNGTTGVVQGDPVFDEVTEHRQETTDKARAKNPNLAAYSGCTDLFSYVAEAIGVEDENFVNRSDDGGRKPWVTGGGPTFITRSAWYKPMRGHPELMESVGPGYAAIIADPWHVCMVKWVDLVAMKIGVYEYGGFKEMVGKASGAFNVHDLKRVGSDWVVIGRFQRVVQGIVPAEEFAKRITGMARLPDDFVLGSPQS